MKSLPVSSLAPMVSLAIVALGCQQQVPQDSPENDLPRSESSAAKISMVEYEVPNMVCEFSCVPTVKKTLAQQPGVKAVQVDFETKTATVSFDPNEFDPEAGRAALVDVQFIDTKLKRAGGESLPADTTTASVAKKTQG